MNVCRVDGRINVMPRRERFTRPAADCRAVPLPRREASICNSCARMAIEAYITQRLRPTPCLLMLMNDNVIQRLIAVYFTITPSTREAEALAERILRYLLTTWQTKVVIIAIAFLKFVPWQSYGGFG